MSRATHLRNPRPRGLRAAWMAALALGVALSAGCSKKATILVETDPAGAALVCNGERYPDAPHTLTGLSGGTYVLSATKPGHREARQVVVIQDGQRVTVRMKLEPIRGLALVHSEPPGAEVTVDGAFRGVTPLFLIDLPVGEHRFSFSAQSHLSREMTVRVEDRVPQWIRAELPINAGRLVVRSEPAGARVLLNGVDRGTTPVDISDAPAGEGVVEIRQPGFVPYTQRLTIVAQEEQQIMGRLEPQPTRMTVVSLPAGARIYANNEYRGLAPLELSDLPPGTVRLRAEMPGYETGARSVELQANVPRTEEFRMAKNSGKLVLVTEPPNVRVFLNGEDRGETQPAANPLMSEPFEVDLLPPGAYTLQLSRAGYRHTPQAVRIERNAVVNLHQRMTRLFVADTRVTLRSGLIRDGMLLMRYPNGKVDLQLPTGTILSIDGEEVLSVEPLSEVPR
jgi:hypothetical protein